MKGTNIELDQRKKKRNLVIGFVVFATVLITVIAATEIVSGLSGKKTDTSKGLEVIRQAEEADVAAIEIKIRKLEERDASGNEESRSLKERFASVVVLGDSITEEFLEYDVLNASSVISGVGIEWEEQVAKLKEINPKVIFMSYCASDILASEGDTKAYIKQYRKRIDEIQKVLPDASIFVNSLQKVSRTVLSKESQYKKLDEYNEALQEMCDKLQIAFVDNSTLAITQYYEEDGIHFKSAFYPIWAERMAEVASL